VFSKKLDEEQAVNCHQMAEIPAVRILRVLLASELGWEEDVRDENQLVQDEVKICCQTDEEQDSNEIAENQV
jgi:hypothetical protein